MKSIRMIGAMSAVCVMLAGESMAIDESALRLEIYKHAVRPCLQEAYSLGARARDGHSFDTLLQNPAVQEEGKEVLEHIVDVFKEYSRGVPIAVRMQVYEELREECISYVLEVYKGAQEQKENARLAEELKLFE